MTTTKHLTTGSPCPPLEPGVLRIYSMKFCPYAERTRLVLYAKNIPHETVNINTYKKPEWFVEKNPDQLVPILELDGKIVYESLITSEYLDEVYADQKPMFPKDLHKKARDKMTIGHFDNKVFAAFWKTAFAKGENEEAKENLLKELAKTEADLKERGTEFFGGSSPGMVDYMIWPLFLRLRSHKALKDQDLPDTLPLLKAWRMRMLEDPAVKSTIITDAAFEEFITHYRTPSSKFDEIQY